MKKSVMSVLLAVVLALTLSSCSDRNRLIKELYHELEQKTGENQEIRDELEEYTQGYTEISKRNETLEYERDAFLEENIELRADAGEYNEAEENFQEILETLLTVTGMYRDDLSDIAEYINRGGEFDPFDEGIQANHKAAMAVFIGEYVTQTTMSDAILWDPEPIMMIIYVWGMPADELHRPRLDNCTYYKVAFYQSLIYPYESEGSFAIPRGPHDGFIDWWLMEVEDTEEGARVNVFEPNA